MCCHLSYVDLLEPWKQCKKSTKVHRKHVARQCLSWSFWEESSASGGVWPSRCIIPSACLAAECTASSPSSIGDQHDCCDHWCTLYRSCVKLFSLKQICESLKPKVSRTNNTCNSARFKLPFARDNKHKKHEVSSCSCTWLLLFDSHSLRVKWAEETRFQV